MHKKKRISQTNPKDSSPIRTSFPTGSRSSDDQSIAAKVDEPKTSEYAFFKKLKSNASHRFNSHQLRKVEIPPNKFKSSDFARERSSPVRNNSSEFRSRIEDDTRVNRGLRPPNGVDFNRASTSFHDICSSGKRMEESRTLRPRDQNENIEALCSETWLNDVKFPRNQNKHEDLFSKKRKKLHQCVADISFPEIEELCSKGYDFVSVLLNRLFPESNEENMFQIPKSERVQRVRTSKLLTSPHSNNQLKQLPRKSTGNFVEVESGPYLENGPSVCLLYSLREENLSSDSPNCHARNNLLDYNLREPSSELKGKDKLSWIDSDSAFSFPLKNYGHFPSVHIRELDDSHDPDVSPLRRVQHPRLLEWDSENMTNQRTSLTSQNTELITYPLSSTSFADDQEWNLHDFSLFGTGELYAPSAICKYPPNFYSLPPSHSTSYCEDDYGRQFLEDNEYTSADLNHYSSILSTLSHIPRYQCPSEGCRDITCEGSRTFLSPRYHHWFMREVSCERHYDPDTESHFSSELDFGLGRECLPICNSSTKHFSSIRPALQFPPNKGILSHFLAGNEYPNRLDGLSSRGILNHYGQDMVNIHDTSSFYFQIPLNKENSCPLLLNKSRWNAFGGK